MKYKILLALVVSCAAVLFTGCVETATGRMTTGVPLLTDTKISRYQRTLAQVSQATETVLARMGKLISHDTINNYYEAKVNQRSVYVHLENVDNGNITQVSVQARTGLGSDIQMAAEIDKQVALQLASGQ
ncbi:MAG: hypothetical protein JWO95_1763 [Verrucomicrobiales bacterium]|nr:hypothetical protein [Verrucomicrobiales bacterium]